MVRRRGAIRTVLACGAAWLVATLASPVVGSSVTVTREVIGGPAPGGCIELVDLDGSGRADVVAGDAGGFTVYPAPAFVPVVVAVAPPATSYAPVCRAADLDGDGDPDLLTVRVAGPGTGAGTATVSWLENPGTTATTWTGHDIGVHPDGVPLDLVLADLNGDGDTDVATRSPGALQIWSDDAGTWNGHTVPVDSGHGLLAADLDGDGDTDLLAGTVLLRNDAGGAWPATPIGPSASASAALADLDGDGTAELVIGPYDTTGTVTRLRPDGSGRWTSTPLVGAGTGVGRKLLVADLDGDGAADLVAPARSGEAAVFLGVLSHRDRLLLDPGGLADAAIGDLDGDGFPELVTTGTAGLVRLRLRADTPSGTTPGPPTRVEVVGGPTPSPTTTTTTTTEPAAPATTPATTPATAGSPPEAPATAPTTPSAPTGPDAGGAARGTVADRDPIGIAGADLAERLELPAADGPGTPIDPAVAVLPESLLRTSKVDVRRVIVAVVALVALVAGFAALRPRTRREAAAAENGVSDVAGARGGRADGPDRDAPTAGTPAS